MHLYLVHIIDHKKICQKILMLTCCLFFVTSSVNCDLSGFSLDFYKIVQSSQSKNIKLHCRLAVRNSQYTLALFLSAIYDKKYWMFFVGNLITPTLELTYCRRAIDNYSYATIQEYIFWPYDLYIKTPFISPISYGAFTDREIV